MDWSARRKFVVLILVGVVVFVALGFVTRLIVVSVQPSCSDGKWNGDERGVDCGGACQLICMNDADNIIIRWVRTSHLVKDDYNAVALIENTNPSAGIESMPYQIRFFDAGGQLITTREGVTAIPPSSIIALYVPVITTTQEVADTFIEFGEPFAWKRTESDFATQPLLVESIHQREVRGLPRVDVTVRNTTLEDLSDIDVVLVGYGGDNNPEVFSRTTISFLQSAETRVLPFTWPDVWPNTIVRFEVFPYQDPYRVGQ